MTRVDQFLGNGGSVLIGWTAAALHTGDISMLAGAFFGFVVLGVCHWVANWGERE